MPAIDLWAVQSVPRCPKILLFANRYGAVQWRGHLSHGVTMIGAACVTQAT